MNSICDTCKCSMINENLIVVEGQKEMEKEML